MHSAAMSTLEWDDLPPDAKEAVTIESNIVERDFEVRAASPSRLHPRAALPRDRRGAVVALTGVAHALRRRQTSGLRVSLHSALNALLEKRMLPDNPFPIIAEQLRVAEASCVGSAAGAAVGSIGQLIASALSTTEPGFHRTEPPLPCSTIPEVRRLAARRARVRASDAQRCAQRSPPATHSGASTTSSRYNLAGGTRPSCVPCSSRPGRAPGHRRPGAAPAARRAARAAALRADRRGGRRDCARGCQLRRQWSGGHAGACPLAAARDRGHVLHCRRRCARCW